MPEVDYQEAATDAQETPGTQEGPGRPFWSGTITFGLVSIPVNLYAATRSSHRGLRMLGPQGKPLQRRYFGNVEHEPGKESKGDKESKESEDEGQALTGAQMVRGYETEKGQYVTVTDEELERLEPEKSRDIDLREFVKVEEVDPIYFERPYFLAPAGSSTKAYKLLAEVMERTGRAGIATFVMRGKEHLVAILSENGILRAETLRFADEVRSPEDVGLPKRDTEPKTEVVRQFEKLIEEKSAEELSRDKLRDIADEDLLRLVAEKRRKHEGVIETQEPVVEQQQPGQVIDIFEALKKSLRNAGKGEERREAKAKAPKKKAASEKRTKTKHKRRTA